MLWGWKFIPTCSLPRNRHEFISPRFRSIKSHMLTSSLPVAQQWRYVMLINTFEIIYLAKQITAWNEKVHSWKKTPNNNNKLMKKRKKIIHVSKAKNHNVARLTTLNEHFYISSTAVLTHDPSPADQTSFNSSLPQ